MVMTMMMGDDDEALKGGRTTQHSTEPQLVPNKAICGLGYFQIQPTMPCIQ